MEQQHLSSSQLLPAETWALYCLTFSLKKKKKAANWKFSNKFTLYKTTLCFGLNAAMRCWSVAFSNLTFLEGISPQPGSLASGARQRSRLQVTCREAAVTPGAGSGELGDGSSSRHFQAFGFHPKGRALDQEVLCT